MPELCHHFFGNCFYSFRTRFAIEKCIAHNIKSKKNKKFEDMLRYFLEFFFFSWHFLSVLYKQQ